MDEVTGAEAYLEALAARELPPLRGGRHEKRDFRAGVRGRDLGPLRLTELVTPAGECFRDARAVRESDVTMWQIDVMARGSVRVEHGGGDTVLGPADLMLIDPVRPVRFASTESRHVTMMVPRTALRLGARVADRLAGVRIPGDSGPGALVSALARDMTRTLGGPLRADQETRSAAAVIELLSVALSARLGDPHPAPDEALRDRITGYIEARLPDPRLTPATVAAAHHMSVRRLHRLFEDEPLTVAALIRTRRLERCHADLAVSGRTVTAVASRWGFPDPAHFSRLFKATYGYTAATLISSNPARMVKAAGAGRGEDGGARTER
ncbi:helix-turn-helix domain-containing protein [Catenuloplanes indicus]|uniref:AraC-like DNA-binding protein n=1 Tax=Catenuloplanes indicus TaxID=137267 RepID=A0AAE3W7Y3_9ACTN|nr:helix-turn-helix domain-containing protein [Catenuloplanes indicus]MDQ0371271.1 AraC-like DNA-binding protein [Catenuloplanes indicus]